jgi:hypothetical protein
MSVSPNDTPDAAGVDRAMSNYPEVEPEESRNFAARVPYSIG